jgi:hypothetical protein
MSRAFKKGDKCPPDWCPLGKEARDAMGCCLMCRYIKANAHHDRVECTKA